jgi:hypothetical protein
MVEYQACLKKAIDATIEDQLRQKTHLKLLVSPGSKRKPTADMVREISLPGLLAQLSHKASRSSRSSCSPSSIKSKRREAAEAEGDDLRAAAYQRLYLPGFQENVLRSLMQWIYHESLHYQDAGHLFAVMRLADKLGVEGLHEICLTKLYTSASHHIQSALVKGIPLRNRFGNGKGQTDDVVEIVFTHVLRDPNTPKRLQDLVIEAFATSLDKELWLQLKPLINHGMALQLVETMVDQKQIKTELYNQPSHKSESEEVVVHTG